MDKLISPTHTHTHTCTYTLGGGGYGERAKCVGEMEGRIDRAARECCSVPDERRQKPPVFPVLQTLLAWELWSTRTNTHTHPETLAYNQLEWSNKGKKQCVPRKYQ